MAGFCPERTGLPGIVEEGPARPTSETLPPGLPGRAAARAPKFLRPRAWPGARPAEALTWLGELRLQRPGLRLGGPAQRGGRSQLGGGTLRRRLRRLRGRRRLRGGGGGVPRRRGAGQSTQRVGNEALEALVSLLPAQRHLRRHDPLPLDDEDALLAGAVLEAAVALVTLEPGQHPVVAAARALGRALQGRPRRLRHRAAHVQVGGTVAVHAPSSRKSWRAGGGSGPGGAGRRGWEARSGAASGRRGPWSRSSGGRVRSGLARDAAPVFAALAASVSRWCSANPTLVTSPPAAALAGTSSLAKALQRLRGAGDSSG